MEKIKRKYLLTLNQNKPNSISPNTTQKKLEAKPGYPLQILIEMLHLAFTSGQKRKHIYKLLIACDSLTPSKPSNTYSKCTAGRALRSIKTCIQIIFLQGKTGVGLGEIQQMAVNQQAFQVLFFLWERTYGYLAYVSCAFAILHAIYFVNIFDNKDIM